MHFLYLSLIRNIIFLIFSLNYCCSNKSNRRTMGENWKNQPNSQDIEEDMDYVKPNETKLEGIPKFLVEPTNLYYVYENKPAKIICIAEPVSHVNIICNKDVYAYMDKELSESNLRVTKMNKNNETDSSGHRWLFSLEISYTQVTEWFNTFSCVCEAWNQIPILRLAKKIHSRHGIIKEAYFKKVFKKVPQSKTLLVGDLLVLTCIPPDSKPKAKIQWMKDNKQLIDNSRIKIIEQQILIEETNLLDEGNYSCLATSLDETRHSPYALVTIKEKVTINHLMEWSPWSSCYVNCSKSRSRLCKDSEKCEQFEKCTKTECEYSKSFFKDAKDIAMYIGLFLAVTVLVIFITIVFCLIRRKTLTHNQNQMRSPLQVKDSGMNHNGKGNTVKYSAPVTIMQNSMNISFGTMMQQRSYLSQSPPNLPSPTFLSEKSNANPYSEGIDLSYNSTGSGQFSQPLLSNSSDTRTNKSKTTSSSNTENKIDSLTMPGTPINSKPSTNLYRELLLNMELPCNVAQCGPESINLNTITRGIISVSGGRLCLPQSGITLTIAPESFANSSSCEMILAVCRNEPNPPILLDTETFLTPVVLFGPKTVSLLKPCVLSVPHSAEIRQDNWVIRLLGSDLPDYTEETEEPMLLPTWKCLATIGHENETTSIYIHLDSYYAYIMLDQPQRICLVGQSRVGKKATKRLRLAAFSRPLSMSSYLPNYNIRIYVFSDSKEAFENVTSREMKLGSTLLDITYQIIFTANLGNLFFCIEELSTGWKSQLAPKYQEISFQDIWSGSQSESLHCAFSFENIDPSQQFLMCRITVYQSGFYNQKQSIIIKQDKKDKNKRDLIQHEKIHLYSENNNTYLDPLMTVFRMPNATRKRLCFLLDNVTRRGNDWKQLCRQMSLNGYVNYFMSKASPTDALLTLWESRYRDENALSDLVMSLKAIGRLDCSSLIESDCMFSSS